MGLLGYGFAPSYGWAIKALIICVGRFAGIAQPALQSYITKHIPANEQRTVQGVFAASRHSCRHARAFHRVTPSTWANVPHDVHLPHVISSSTAP